MPFIFSTITNDTAYCAYTWPDGDTSGKRTPILSKRVTIKGGNGVADKRLVTPRGTVTEVTDEDLAFLKENSSFQRHMKEGFIKIGAFNTDPAKAAKDMAERDGSAPKTDETIKEVSGAAKVAQGNADTIMGKIGNMFKG